MAAEERPEQEEEDMTTTDAPTNGAATTTAIQKAPIQVGSRGVELRTLDDMWRFSNYYANSGLAPKGMDRPESIFIAMQAGQELGLGYFQSVQSIANINNRPALWGDAMKGLVLAHPSCEYITEWMEEDQSGFLTAWCESKRRGAPRSHKVSFSQADAQKAGLWGKSGPWTQYPKRMLQMRARSFNLRDNFADVLRGLAVVEEVQDIEPSLAPAAPAAPVAVESATVVDAPPENRTEAARREMKRPQAKRPTAQEANPETPVNASPEPTAPEGHPAYKIWPLPKGITPIDWQDLRDETQIFGIYDSLTTEQRKAHWSHATDEVQRAISAACKAQSEKEKKQAEAPAPATASAAAEQPAATEPAVPVDEAREFVDSRSVKQLHTWFGRQTPSLLEVGRAAAGVAILSEANEEQVRAAAYAMRKKQGQQ